MLLREAAQRTTGGDGLSAARELGLWLRALRSFFDHSNHPFTEGERALISTRDFSCETAIARDVLLRCLQLTGALTPGEPDAPAPHDGEAPPQPDGRWRHTSAAVTEAGLDELTEILKDACSLAGALLEAPSVKFEGWASLGGVLTRELKASETARLLTASPAGGGAPFVPGPLTALAERLTPDDLGEDIFHVFTSFTVLLSSLRFVETRLRSEAQVKQLLPLFTLVHDDTRGLLDFIESRGLRTEGMEEGARDALDGTAYAIRMELRKIFEHELVDFCSLRQPSQVFVKAENALGLLRDSFQQSTLAVAQSFDPAVEGSQLFASFHTKLEQSLALRSDLWGLLQLVRRAGGEIETFPMSLLLERLNAFREGSQRYLMFKDWEPFERFLEEIESAGGATEAGHVLHRFDAFLETLFNQVNMRGVLASQPFDPASTAAG
ncbi:MAG TPA: hypothetical protein VK422_01500 [Pyrinomonadaceae bacterium]|nr:hypothetical protein [Pyrinomonadaceae bacterium]